ncbi:MAG: serine/threonine-protein phosphatase [Leptospirales bacterium]|nr:serine/threonine-protein phosphatase [Leptospirales bacterium]
MNLARIAYLTVFCLLTVLTWFLAEPGGRRLPRYYTPNGDIVPIGYFSEARRIYSVGGRDPAVAGPLAGDALYVRVETDLGPTLMATVPNTFWIFLYHFRFFLLLAVVFSAGIIWFLRSAADFHLAALSACMALFHFSLSFTLAYHKMEYLWRLSSALAPLLIFNAALRLTGKDAPGRLIVGELIFVAFLALVAYVGGESAAAIGNFEWLISGLFVLSLVAALGLLFDNALRRTDDRIERWKRWALFAGFALGLALPLALAQFAIHTRLPMPPVEWISALVFFFPLTVAYGTYRLNVLPFQLTLSRSIVAAALSVALTMIYGLFLLLHALLLPEQETKNHWLANAALILAILLLLDPMRRRISAFVERNFLRLNAELSESLKRIAGLLSEDSRLQPTALAFLNEVASVLQLESAAFLAAGPGLAALNVRREVMIRVPAGSSMWRYLKPEQMGVSAYLAYAGGRREELFRFLYRNRFSLAIGILGGQKAPGWSAKILQLLKRSHRLVEAREDPGTVESYRAALLVGYRSGGRKLALREIRYLQEAARLASQLFLNYAVLIQEISKRRRIRALAQAGHYQRSLSRTGPDRVAELQIAFVSRAAVSVTGDYFDILALPDRKLAIFLGDVTGHGVAAGYLASSLRAIVRTHLTGGGSLAQTVQTMNRFLMERYQGSEFITLFAMVVDLNNGQTEYINAAHPAPFLVRNDGRLEQLVSNQRLIGILPTPYFTNQLQLQRKDRLYIYSDGVTETFNASEEAYGEARLLDYIEGNGSLSVDELISKLERQLADFRGNASLSDDTTFVALQFEPPQNPLRGLVAALGLDRFWPGTKAPREEN